MKEMKGYQIGIILRLSSSSVASIFESQSRRLARLPVFAIATFVLLSGCASPAKSPNDYTPRTDVKATSPRLGLALGQVILGYAPSSAYEGEMARKGFENALRASELFDETSKSRVNVSVTNLVADADQFGLSMTARVFGAYALTNNASQIIFQTSVQSSAEVPFGEAVVGAERQAIAIRRAIAGNFALFIQELSNLPEGRRQSIEAAAGTQGQPPPVAHDRGADKIVSGTGFFINGQGDAITNRHVVDRCKTITARLRTGASYPAELAFVDEINDLAVVRISSVELVPFATFNSTQIYREGDAVVVYGFPLAGALSETGNLTTGTVTALAGLGNDTRHLQISAPIQSGNSGGPVADERGNVIGVVVSKINAMKVLKVTGDLTQNINFAIKDVVVKSFLQANGVRFSESSLARRLSPADIGDLLKGFVVNLQCRQE